MKKCPADSLEWSRQVRNRKVFVRSLENKMLWTATNVDNLIADLRTAFLSDSEQIEWTGTNCRK
ncbi:hypothetical protein IJ750_03695 [bacterium]|nr:hypothetical protein [bacterium]